MKISFLRSWDPNIRELVAGASVALVARLWGAAARLGVAFLTVHALGGPEMIHRGVQAAAEAAAEAGHPPPVVLAVTILTSHDDDDLRRIGVDGTGREAVTRLAELARDAGAGGIVCSPLEIAEVRRAFPSATLVVPGIRPAELSVGRDDQARTATPAEAVRAGADRLVIGRPITAAPDPAVAAEVIARGIDP